MTMLGVIASSFVLFEPAIFYVDSRDAVDNGSGKVASVTDRISGFVFAANTAGNEPKIDTALLGGTKLILSDTSGMNLQYSGANGFGGDDTPVSFVCRMRRTSTGTLSILSTHVPNTPGSLAQGRWELGAVSTTTIRTSRTAAPSATTDYDTTTTWSNNTWYTIGVSFTGSSIRVFKDGVFVQAHTSNLTTLGAHSVITLGSRSSLGNNNLRGYYAAWKGWAGKAISDAQHLYEHNQLAAWAA